MSNLIFVFGTLKEGFPNFGSNAGVRVSGKFKTLNRYPLYLVGSRYSPWMMNSPGGGEHVTGEVFRVDANALARMDLLERVSEEDGYRRILIKVCNLDASASDPIDVYAYLKPQQQLRSDDIKEGPFGEYSLAHAALYRSRAQGA